MEGLIARLSVPAFPTFNHEKNIITICKISVLREDGDSGFAAHWRNIDAEYA